MSATLALYPAVPPAPRVHSADALCRAMRAAQHARAEIDYGGLDRVLRKDAAQGLIEVQYRTPWQALAAALADEVPALADALVTAGLTGTVGASIAANAPGPDGVPVIALLESLTVVTAEGELKRASRAANADLFRLAVGGFDLFAATYSATLSIAALARAAAAPGETAVLALDEARGERRLGLLLPPEALERFLAEARGCAEDWRVPLARIEVSRTAPEDETVLRWARREWALVRLEFSLPAGLARSVRAVQFVRALVELAIAHGGAYEIASTPEASREQAEACHPALARFLAEKRRLDPGERLRNTWYRHHRRLLRREPVAVRWDARPARASQAASA